MASDFTLIFRKPLQFGSNPGVFDDESVFDPNKRGEDIEHAGLSREFVFETPGADPDYEAILSFCSYDVTYSFNEMSINGNYRHGAISATSVRGEWSTGQIIIPAGTLRAQGDNALYIAAANAGPDDEPVFDNFVLSNMSLLYKLA